MHGIAENQFHRELAENLHTFLRQQEIRFPKEETLKMDLHVHDLNSNEPDERMGRILNLPETWLPTDQLVNTLRQRDCRPITITNHNNARSCYELQGKGIDVLTGAEFSCFVPEYQIGIHVLTYGFTPEEEVVLNKLRKNIYQFQQYTLEHNLPTIWAHPLFIYTARELPPFSFFQKMALLFERFEVLNGQRDTWQNLLVKKWVKGLTPDTIARYAEQTGIDPEKYCMNPFRKSISGGSDCHMGIFSGLTGTYLHVPDLSDRLMEKRPSELALEAIREGRMAPYGSFNTQEKLTISFLDYISQITLYGQDPGLLRILLHKGTHRDKLLAIFVSNGLAELRRHKVTMKFVSIFHNGLAGKRPGFLERLWVPRAYRPVFREVLLMAEADRNDPESMSSEITARIHSISRELNALLCKRLGKKLRSMKWDRVLESKTLEALLARFELPSELRSYMESAGKRKTPEDGSRISHPDIPGILDGLSFPFLASGLILASHFTSSRVMFASRPMLTCFAEMTGHFRIPGRALWLVDEPGVSGISLEEIEKIRKEVVDRNLPVDILRCSNAVDESENLRVIRPILEIPLNGSPWKSLLIPDFLEIHTLFQTGAYDRVIGSTEGPMGLAAIYLRHAYQVPAWFQVYTNWLAYVHLHYKLEQGSMNRLRRLIRAFYLQFDQLWVSDPVHLKWLTGKSIGFDSSRVHCNPDGIMASFRAETEPVKINNPFSLA